MNHLRRTTTAVAVALALGAMLTACGSGSDSADDDTSTDTSTDNGAAPAAEAGVFPATITHKYGSTEVTEAPQRVVTVGLTEQDALLGKSVV